MILYSAKSTIDAEGHSTTRITKFVDGEVESSYLTTPATCDCPAGVRPTCRHRQMLPHMIQCDIINTHWFYNFDRGLVVDFEGVSRQAHEMAKPASEALQGNLPLTLGEPLIDIQGPPGQLNEFVVVESRPSTAIAPTVIWRRF